MTVCADVEALIPMQTPFSQFCPGGQCSFPPSSSHSFAPFPPTLFLLFLPQFYSHFVKQIPTNSAWTSSSLLYSHSSLSLSLLFQILIPANQTKPNQTIQNSFAHLHFAILLPNQTNYSELTCPLNLRGGANKDFMTKPNQANPNQTKPNQAIPNQTKPNLL